ncbi:MAG: YeeE/YedE family protein [Alphaproteobacteria bacterium]|nr:YeeE/YedE family protein [Alphaproteobacteria bacterium]
MESFDPVTALAGGALIGLAATLLMAGLGRIAGASGILMGVLAPPGGEAPWRLEFVAGLVAAPFLMALMTGGLPEIHVEAGLPALAAAGLLVGIGTQIGSGCTSGHGVCGLARLSPRSLVATPVFMASCALTVYVTRHLLGG